jgi:hypothetical protein
MKIGKEMKQIDLSSKYGRELKHVNWNEKTRDSSCEENKKSDSKHMGMRE